MVQKLVKLLFYNVKAFIKLLILCSILSILAARNIYADDPKDALDTIVDTLKNLTCETQGVGDLLRSEFSHTCIPAPFFTVAVASVVSPVMYINTMLRLKINDHELFDDKFPGGQCARNQKLDYDNPVLTFALCNNVDLATVRLKAIAESAAEIAKAVFTGTDPWDDILKVWKGNKKAYHRIQHMKDGETYFMMDPLPTYIKVARIKDTMCVTTPGIFGYVPVGCKYIKEPYPDSIYKSFVSPEGDSEKGPKKAQDPMAIVDCGLNSSSCYQRAYNNSKTAIVITAPLIECFKEMTARLLISRDVCSFDDVNKVINSSKRETSILFKFQRNMHRTVTALLTLYVMFFGFKIILSGDIPPKKDIINFVLKILFVTYFSVGININVGGNNEYGRLDGMIQWAFPILLGGIDTLAGWIMNATPSGLCKFNGPDIIYDAKLAYMSLWDALDCRVSHYLGLDILSTLLVENTSKDFDFFSFSAPPYVYLLIPAIISGNLTLISLALAYPLLVLSVAAFLINATVMCMICIVVLGVLAPLFVPMFLFEYTRGYFESWVKLLISFLLQPMVVTTFMILMFSVYDVGFYGHCRYNSKIIDSGIESSILNKKVEKRKVKIFYINHNWSEYADEEEIKSCKNSLGYMLNNPLSTVFDFAKDSVEEIVKEKPGSISTDEHLKKFSFLQGIVMSPGMFFVAPKLIFEKIKGIILALLTACFTLYLMYHFSAQLAGFAADMTEGVALSNVTINPQAVFKAGMAAAAAAGGMMSADSAATGKLANSKDTIAQGRGSRDSMSIGKGRSTDSMSTGKGIGTDSVGTGKGGNISPSMSNIVKGNNINTSGSSADETKSSTSSKEDDLGNELLENFLQSQADGGKASGLPVRRAAINKNDVKDHKDANTASESKVLDPEGSQTKEEQKINRETKEKTLKSVPEEVVRALKGTRRGNDLLKTSAKEQDLQKAQLEANQLGDNKLDDNKAQVPGNKPPKNRKKLEARKNLQEFAATNVKKDGSDDNS